MTRPSEESRLARMRAAATAATNDPPPRRRPHKLGTRAIAAAIATILGVAGAVADRASSRPSPPPPPSPSPSAPPTTAASPPSAPPTTAASPPSTPPSTPVPCAYGQFTSPALSACALDTHVMHLRSGAYNLCREKDDAYTDIVLRNVECATTFEVQKCATQDAWQLKQYFPDGDRVDIFEWLHFSENEVLQLDPTRFKSSDESIGPCYILDYQVSSNDVWYGPLYDDGQQLQRGLFVFDENGIQTSDALRTFKVDGTVTDGAVVSAEGSTPLDVEWCFTLPGGTCV